MSAPLRSSLLFSLVAVLVMSNGSSVAPLLLVEAQSNPIGGFYTRIYKYSYDYSGRRSRSSTSSAKSSLRSFIARKLNSVFSGYGSVSSSNIYLVSYYSRYSYGNGYYYDVTWYWVNTNAYDYSDSSKIISNRNSLGFSSIKWCPYKYSSSSSSSCSFYYPRYSDNYVINPANPYQSTPNPYSGYYTPSPPYSSNNNAASDSSSSSSGGSGWVTPVIICSVIFVFFVIMYVRAKSARRATMNGTTATTRAVDNNNTAFSSPLMNDYDGSSKGTTEMQEFLVGGGLNADPVQPASDSTNDWSIPTKPRGAPPPTGGGVYSDHNAGATGKVYCADGSITSGNGSAPAGWGTNDTGDWGGRRGNHTTAANWGSGW